MVTSGQVDNAVLLAQEVRNTKGIDINAETVRRALRETGLRVSAKKKKPRLLPRHVKQRLEFAEKYRHWTLEDWSRVLCSDETKINRWGSDGRVWVWKKPSSQL